MIMRKKISQITNNNIELSEPLVFLDKAKLFKNKNLITKTVENIQYVLMDKKNNKINLSSKLTNTNTFKENLFIGEVLPTDYKTKTGGYLNNLNIQLSSNKKTLLYRNLKWWFIIMDSRRIIFLKS